MAHDRRIDDQDLTEADRVVMGLYDQTREPIAWDESDDAILAFAREIHAEGPPAAETSADGEEESDGNVVQFGPRKRSFVNRIIHSPATGFAMAASLVVGVFVGQGINPYVDLGVSPGQQVVSGNGTELTRGLGTDPKPKTRGVEVGTATPAGTTTAPHGTVLGAVAESLRGYDCADLSATVTAEKQIVVGGFVSTAQDLQRLTQRIDGLRRQADIVNRARVLGPPFCGALGVLARAGGVQASAERLPVVRPHDHGSRYTEGQRLVIEASASTSFAGYIYVDFVQHDGSVLHMMWSEDQVGRSAAAGQQFLLGTSGQTFTIVPPFGDRDAGGRVLADAAVQRAEASGRGCEDVPRRARGRLEAGVAGGRGPTDPSATITSSRRGRQTRPASHPSQNTSRLAPSGRAGYLLPRADRPGRHA